MEHAVLQSEKDLGSVQIVRIVTESCVHISISQILGMNYTAIATPMISKKAIRNALVVPLSCPSRRDSGGSSLSLSPQ
ncbi:hypothetical protein VNO77_22822 [Canavalia gladiata]|uniref:Uncharacterized protein n=1 Tax=Canavalia gladiata TaxID=3824 RepID=A0AAN9L3B5_CANGL